MSTSKDIPSSTAERPHTTLLSLYPVTESRRSLSFTDCPSLATHTARLALLYFLLLNQGAVSPVVRCEPAVSITDDNISIQNGHHDTLRAMSSHIRRVCHDSQAGIPVAPSSPKTHTSTSSIRANSSYQMDKSLWQPLSIPLSRSIVKLTDTGSVKYIILFPLL